MWHLRPDYNRIQDPSNLIPEEEPVMLFRGQDKFAPMALVAYAAAMGISSNSKDAPEIIELCMQQAINMLEWQKNIRQKEPDLLQQEEIPN